MTRFVPSVSFFSLVYTIFIFLSFSSYLRSQENVDCVDAIQICSDEPFSGDPDLVGLDDFDDQPGAQGCLSSGERATLWYTFTINGSAPAGSELEFTIDPENGPDSEDYDFAIWGPDVECDALGSPVRCSFAGPSCSFCPLTGLGMGTTDNSEGAGGDGFVAPLIVNPGETYILAIDNFAQDGNGFSVSFGGSAAPYLACCPLEFTVTDEVTLCSDGTQGDYTFDVVITEGNGPFVFEWTSTNGLSYLSDPTAQNPTVSFPSGVSGQFIYNIQVTMADTCIVDREVVIDVFAPPVVDAGDAGVLDNCNNLTLTLTGTVDDLPDNAVITWTTADGNIVTDPNQLIIDVDQPGTYVLEVSSVANCTSSDLVTVTGILDEPVFSLSGDPFLSCDLEVATLFLNIEGTWDFIWSTSEGNILSEPTAQSIEVDLPGWYFLTITDDAGCEYVDSIFLDQNIEEPMVLLEVTGLITCLVSEVIIVATGSASYSYSWTTQDGVIEGLPVGSSIVASAPGTYTVNITDFANGCTSQASMIVESDTVIPDFTVSDPLSLSCLVVESEISVEGLDGDGNYSIIWSTADGVIDTDPFLPTITVSEAGSYTVVVTDLDNGCLDFATVMVEENLEGFDILYEEPLPLGCDRDSVLIDASASDFEEGLVVNWISLEGNPILDDGLTAWVYEPGVYTLELFDPISECSSSVDIEVLSLISYPDISIVSTTQINCFSSEGNVVVDGGPADEVTYQWETEDGMILSGEESSTVVVGTEGNYTVVVTDIITGCNSELTIPVSEDSAEPVFSILTDEANIDCNNTLETIEIEIEGDPNLYDISWVTNDGDIVSQSNTEIEVSLPGIYYVSVTNPINGCSSQDSVFVEDLRDLPNSDLTIDYTLNCSQTSILLDGTSIDSVESYVYSWSTDDGNVLSGDDMPVVEVNEFGSYLVQILNPANGCFIFDSIEVLPDTISPDIDTTPVDLITCANSTTTISVLSPSLDDLFFEWLDPSGASIVSDSSNSIQVESPGTYSVTATSLGNGCSQDIEINVGIDTSSPTANVSDAEILSCAVNSISLNSEGSSTGGQFTYEWSSATGGIISNVEEPSIDVNSPGFFFLTVTDESNGCIDVDSVEVVVDENTPAAIIAESSYTVNCNQSTVTLDGSASSDDPSFEFEWTFEGQIISGAGNSIDTDQEGWYFLEVTNPANGCVSLDSALVIRDFEYPEASIDGDDLITCLQPMVTLSTGSSIFTEDTEAFWEFPDASIQNADATSTIEVDEEGSYSLVLIDQSSGCSDTSAVLLEVDTVAPELVVQEPGLITCLTPTVTAEVETNLSDPTISWYDDDSEILSDMAQISINTPGNYSIQVLNPLNGCASTASFVVGIDTVAPFVDLAIPDELSCDEPISVIEVLSSSQGDDLSFMWMVDSEVLEVSDIAQNLDASEPGIYVLSVVNDANGCTDFSSVEVIDNREQVSADLDISQPDCGELLGSVAWSNVVGNEPVLVSTDGGSVYQDISNIEDLSEGEYNIVFQDALGCVQAYDFSIVPAVAPNGFLSEDEVSISLGQNYQIDLELLTDLSLLQSIEWFGDGVASLSCTDCLDPIASPTATTLYRVLLTSVDGCEQELSILVRVSSFIGVYIPNVFSPNGDDANEVLYVQGGENLDIRVLKMDVYDRWGSQVFASRNGVVNDPSHGWDGSHAGESCANGVYLYAVEVELPNGIIQQLNGDVTLLR